MAQSRHVHRLSPAVYRPVGIQFKVVLHSLRLASPVVCPYRTWRHCRVLTLRRVGVVVIAVHAHVLLGYHALAVLVGHRPVPCNLFLVPLSPVIYRRALHRLTRCGISHHHAQPVLRQSHLDNLHVGYVQGSYLFFSFASADCQLPFSKRQHAKTYGILLYILPLALPFEIVGEGSRSSLVAVQRYLQRMDVAHVPEEQHHVLARRHHLFRDCCIILRTSNVSAPVAQFVDFLPVLPFRQSLVYKGYLLARVTLVADSLFHSAPHDHLVVLAVVFLQQVCSLHALVVRQDNEAQQVVVEVAAVLALLYERSIPVRLPRLSV